jgi:tetraacyldisaccharide 4'-kinase
MTWLAPLGLFYATLMRLRVWLFQKGFLASHRLPGKVISVGNLEVGGTGKSPIVIALAEHLLSSGAHPVILTRGYRSGLGSEESAAYRGSELILPPQKTSVFYADEARMQAQKLKNVPVILGADRWAAARRYLHNFPCPTHWILDDGFQHLRIHRDLDLVLLDAQKPFDNGHCLPAGRLREPVQALSRADVLLLTRSSQGPDQSELERLRKIGKPLFKVFFSETLPQQMSGPSTSFQTVQTWGLALGIARPERVKESLKRQGVYPKSELIVLDHQSFSPHDLAQLAKTSDALLTTEKDFWRSPESFAALDKPVFVLPLKVEWEDRLSLSDLFSPLTD